MRSFFRWLWAKRWRRWAIVLGVPLFLVANIGVVEATSHAEFCKTCHIMGTYYDSWHASSHAHVQCVKCHIDPGVDSFIHAKLNGLGQVVDDLLHRTSNKPSASVGQLACTRAGCHSIERVRESRPAGVYLFDHGKHLDLEHMGVKVGCSTCHAHIKGDQHFEINTDACITCHLVTVDRNGVHQTSVERRTESVPIRMAVREGEPPKGADAANGRPPANRLPPTECAACHVPPSQPFEYNGLTIDHDEYLSYGAACTSCHQNVTATPEPITDSKCIACHTFGVERALPAAEMHKVHLEGRHKVECFSCHGVMRHGPAAEIMPLDQFDCRNCHQDQHAIQRRTYLLEGTGSAPTPAQVSPMFLSHVDCTGCHVEPHPLSGRPHSGATVKRPTPEACDACHRPGLGEKMIPLWQNAARDLYQQAEGELAALGPAPEGDARGEALRREARELLDIVRSDGSWGVHNPRYTHELLDRARNKVREAAGLPPLPQTPYADPAP